MKNCVTTSNLPQSRRRSVLSNIKYEHLLAGMSGGAISTFILHPLDLLKVRFAVNDGRLKFPQYNSLTQAFSNIVKNEGIRGLYKGVTPNMWGAGSGWGFYFLFYNTIKSSLQGGDTSQQLGAANHLMAASLAGTLTLFMTNPIWVVKTRLCLQYETTMLHQPIAATASSNVICYKGMVDAFRKIYGAEGVRGLYRGFTPGLFGVTHGALQFMAYEEMKAYYNHNNGLPYDNKLTTREYLTFAAVSKLIAAFATYPYQVLRTRMQDQHHSYKGLNDCISITWKYEGLRGFYKGLVPYLLHVTPNICLIMIIYEKFTNNT